MTDNDIIKALEKVKQQYGTDCYTCEAKSICRNKTCPFHTCDYALYLIKRQQAEIERLERIAHSYMLQYGTAAHKEVFFKKETKDYTKAQMLTWYNKLWTDSAEYKMWGNGIALPPALYCMQGIADKLKAMEGI